MVCHVITNAAKEDPGDSSVTTLTHDHETGCACPGGLDYHLAWNPYLYPLRCNNPGLVKNGLSRSQCLATRPANIVLY